MKFRLSSTDDWYDDEGKNRLEKLGFQFEIETDSSRTTFGKWYKISKEDDNPIYIEPTIELATIEELVAFQKELGDLILLADSCIEIYDGYRE